MIKECFDSARLHFDAHFVVQIDDSLLTMLSDYKQIIGSSGGDVAVLEGDKNLVFAVDNAI